MLPYAYNLSTQKAEAGGMLCVRGQSGLLGLSQKAEEDKSSHPSPNSKCSSHYSFTENTHYKVQSAGDWHLKWNLCPSRSNKGKQSLGLIKGPDCSSQCLSPKHINTHLFSGYSKYILCAWGGGSLHLWGCVCVHVCGCVSRLHCTQYSQRSEEGILSQGTGVTGECETPWGWWELSLIPLKEWPVLLTVEPSLLPISKLTSKLVFSCWITVVCCSNNCPAHTLNNVIQKASTITTIKL